MLIGARTGAWSGGAKLPYDKRVEYLKGSGSAWIDTGIVPSLNTCVDAMIAPSKFDGNYRLGVAYQAGSTYGFSLMFYQNSRWFVDMFRGRFTLSASYVANKKYRIVLSDTLCSVQDGDTESVLANVARTASTAVPTQAKKHIAIFGATSGWSAASDALYVSASTDKVYYCRIYEGDVLVFDGVPVVKDGVGCFYDAVSGEIKYAKGGDLVIGPDV